MKFSYHRQHVVRTSLRPLVRQHYSTAQLVEECLLVHQSRRTYCFTPHAYPDARRPHSSHVLLLPPHQPPRAAHHDRERRMARDSSHRPSRSSLASRRTARSQHQRAISHDILPIFRSLVARPISRASGWCVVVGGRY